MINKLLRFTIIATLVFGAIYIGYVSYLHYLGEIKCSEFLLVPACYLGAFYFTVLLFFQIYERQILLFFIFLGAGLALSIYASIGYLQGNIACVPILDIPLCYMVFAVFLLIMFLKFTLIKNTKIHLNNATE